jgi:membrane-associated phospholipid phosphatase
VGTGDAGFSRAAAGPAAPALQDDEHSQARPFDRDAIVNGRQGVALHPIWGFLTDFGDSAITVPVSLLTFVFLIIIGQRPLAVGWGIAILGCASAIGALKILFAPCGRHLAFAALASPSGHAAMTTVVYGSLAMLLGTSVPRRFRTTLDVAAAFLVAAIAMSRLALGAHDVAEVIVGLIVGLAALAGFRRILLAQHPVVLPVGWLAGAAMVVIAVFHGARWPTERVVQALAALLHLAMPWCG